MASTTATPTRRSARTDNSTNGTAPRTRRSTGRAGTAKDGAAASAVIRASARTKTPPHALSTTLPEGVKAASSVRKSTGTPASGADEAAAKQTHVALLYGTTTFMVHKADCPRVAGDLKKSDYESPMQFSPATQEAAIRDLWEDQIREQAAGDKVEGEPPVSYLFDHGYVGETKFHSCSGLDKLAKPKPEIDPAGAKRAAKTELATRAVEAIAAMVAELVKNDPKNPIVVTLGGPAEVAKCAAHWVHHLPADRERWVAAGLPKPNRSDWR